MRLVYEIGSKKDTKADSCEELHLQYASTNTLKRKLYDRIEAFVALACNDSGKGKGKTDE